MSTDTRRESSGDTKTADTTDGSDATSLMLYTLVAFGDVEKAKECFDNGLQYQVSDAAQESPLAMAVRLENYRMATLLCMYGADACAELSEDQQLDMRVQVAVGMRSIEENMYEYMISLATGVLNVKSIDIFGRYANGLMTDDELKFNMKMIKVEHANELREAEQYREAETEEGKGSYPEEEEEEPAKEGSDKGMLSADAVGTTPSSELAQGQGDKVTDTGS